MKARLFSYFLAWHSSYTLIEKAFELLTGHPISTSHPIFVQRFSHGGMSSGYIYPDFWRDKAIALLHTRFAETYHKTQGERL